MRPLYCSNRENFSRQKVKPLRARFAKNVSEVRSHASSSAKSKFTHLKSFFRYLHSSLEQQTVIICTDRTPSFRKLYCRALMLGKLALKAYGDRTSRQADSRAFNASE